MINHRLNVWTFFPLIFLTTIGCFSEPKAEFVRKVDWTGTGHWLKADFHVHTRFSDGAYTVEEVVAKAVEFGVKVLAITDHSDHDLRAASPNYFQQINAARLKFPNVIILAGLEWNVPPWGGKEHVSVIIHPSLEELPVLAEAKDSFDTYNPLSVVKKIFDDYERKDHVATLADDCLKWLKANATVNAIPPIVIYNHPSRKNEESMESVANIQKWRSINDLVIGFEGSPGHQGNDPIGSYKYEVKTVDRWDPAAAQVGDAWDTLLQEGIDVWAAFANSDFHNVKTKRMNDKWPGEFSETWIYVPDKSPEGVLKALRAGSFFAAHGHIVRKLDFTVAAAGVSRPAAVGETIKVKSSSAITARIQVFIPELDWKGQPNKIDTIELIGITKEKANILKEFPVNSSERMFEEIIEVPAGGIVLRIRGRRVDPQAPDLMFYSNPIRIVTY